jgi:ubiquinone/menaquinone biosynthesis C-methylase UbiE
MIRFASPGDDPPAAKMLTVKPDEVRKHIEQAAIRFNAELHTESYAKTHSDSAQLRRLLSLLSPRAKQVFLDLGTGNGYVGTALAKAYPTSRVVGVDIAEKAIEQDVRNARQQGLSNVHFRVFDGVTLPFRDSYFDGAVCRYAFHHLPCPETTLEEMARTLRRGGKFVLADPVRHEDDETDFINRFQDLRRDGHVRIHRFGELVDLVGRHGFELIDWFRSSISFGRQRTREYDELLASTPARVHEGYALTIAGTEIRIAFSILNAAFLHRNLGT